MKEIPANAKWQKVAISKQVDRYVLDVSKYGFPYFEVEWIGFGGEDYVVSFVVPGKGFSLNETREIVDKCNKFDHIEAIKQESKKRGLPDEVEEEK